MRFDLSGKKAVVTGAGAGIGLAVTRALAGAGADVLGGARTVSAALKECTPYTMEVDLLAEDGPQRLVRRALDEFGGVDILVNNVGGGVKLAAGFLEIDDETWRHTLDLNVFTMIRATRAALPSLVERQGAVVNIGSMNAAMADPRLAHYSAAKAAVSNISKALSAEFSPQGVRVNTILPGPVKTRLWTDPSRAAKAGVTPEEFLEMVTKMSGLSTGQLIEPEEIGELVLLLASGRIRSVTGTDIHIDAGMVPPSRYQRPN
ncbi:SDR family NAD(P)-dependent oxidoreductase [Micromonospora sp. RTGN7]|uniref:SDR family NAD(P)-dependent oxidoreductase n=1 Tax=Micromonospora sp. RTGN7 TaxID=3016526 RepID=UPI0029FF4A6E|nr:SDR family oxidoreductase [Micromonospora sp. RTGN7]